MRRIFLVAGIAIAASVLVATAAANPTLAPLEKGKLPRIAPPKISVVVLENGLRCFLLEDHTLPMVEVKAITRVGATADPADEVGLAQVTGMLLRSGGAGDRAPEAFDAAVDDIGASMSSLIDREMGEAGLVVLSDDLEQGLSLFFDMLFAPRFDEKRLAFAKLKIEEGLRREEDDPDALASRHFRQFVYGAESPWARRPDPASLARIPRAKVEAFHHRFFSTSNMLLAVAGDFDSKALLALLRSHTATAPSQKVEQPVVPEVVPSFEPGVKEIVRPLTQSFIRLGHLGIKRTNPDKYALILMNAVLGANNFKSRLMEDIRTKRGMAYSIDSDLIIGSDLGLFRVSVDTKSKQTEKVIDLIRGHIARMAKGDDVTRDELEFARQSALARLVFEFDNAFKVVDNQATYFYYGYPDDYWRIFRDKIAGVSVGQVEAAAKKYLHPEGLKVVVVGPKLSGTETSDAQRAH